MDVSGLKFKKRYFIDKYSRSVNDFVPESLSDETELLNGSKTETDSEDLSNAEPDTADE
jgi:hypothetical protein